MTRHAAVILFACGLAVVAAPVPKATLKFEDVYGEVADPKSECKFQVGKGGGLTVTVPTAQPTLEPSTGSTCPPMVGKTVDGDFVLTVRVVVTPPDEVKGKNHTYLPAVFAGVSVVSADDPTLGLTAGVVRRRKPDEWAGDVFASSRRPGQCIGGNYTPLGKADGVRLRVTRRGDQMDLESSTDGKTWERFLSETVKGMTGPVKVGPVAFGCIDQEFPATFDQYKIEPLKEGKK